jgi:signal transduction histidine kinase
VRFLARLPLNLRSKLYIAFVGIVLLLVTVGILGLQVLGRSNGRVEQLEALQVRAAAYRGLQTDAEQVRQLIALRAGNNTASNYSGKASTPILSQAGRVTLDEEIKSLLGALGLAEGPNQLGSSLPSSDEAAVGRIRQDHLELTAITNRILNFDRKGGPAPDSLQRSAEGLANDIQAQAIGLVSASESSTQALVAQSSASFSDSERLSVAVAVFSIALAMTLGFVLSLSLIGPIRRVEGRVAEIASGDFSGHVEVPNRDELGALAANVNAMNDELKRLYDELETVSKHKSEFLANMSHELRTPLNAIIGFSEVLQQQMFGELNEQQLGYVSDVLDAGRHLLSLINDILDLAKVEAGRMELDLADVSLPETLRSGLTMNGERASRAGITLALTLDPEEIVVRADERKIRQVVFNLLSNAVKFTPAGGRVDVSARLSDGFAEVAVADTGTGIGTEDQGLIFEEFGQAKNGASQEGTGLGLPLSKRFIDLHGGQLWVESVPGQGSTFRFTLPLEGVADG